MRGYGTLFPGYEYTKLTWTQPSCNTSHNRTSRRAFPLGLQERFLGTSEILWGGRNNACQGLSTLDTIGAKAAAG